MVAIVFKNMIQSQTFLSVPKHYNPGVPKLFWSRPKTIIKNLLRPQNEIKYSFLTLGLRTNVKGEPVNTGKVYWNLVLL